MKLFGHDTSPYVRRVRSLLQELDVQFERDKAGWVDPSPEFSRLSPVGRVPLLLVERPSGELPIFDSKTIADYLLTHHAPSLPSPPSTSSASLPFQPTLFHPAHRYEDENVLTMIDAALDSGIQLFVFARDGIKPNDAPYLRRQSARVDNCLRAVDALYSGRSSLHDEVFGFVDLAAISCFDWFRFRDVCDVAAHVNLFSLLEQNRNRRSISTTDPRLA